MAESNATQVILTDDGLKIIKAQNTADEAVGNINDINSDNKLTPSEKIKLKQEYDKDVELYNIDIGQLKSVNLPTAELDIAMSNLTNFVTPLFKEMNITSTVDRNALNSVFTAFATADKNASQAFVNMVQQVADDAKKAGDDAKAAGEKAQVAGEEAKTSADQAQADAIQAKADATKAQADATTAQNSAQQALDNITVVDSKVDKLSTSTTAQFNTLTDGYQEVISTVNNMDIGGTNLLKNSKFDNKMNNWRIWCPQGMGTSTVKINETGGGDWPRQAIYLAEIVNTEADKNNQFGIAQDNVSVEPNAEYTFQLFNDGADPITVQHGNGSNDPYVTKALGSHRTTWTFKIPAGVYNTNIYIGFDSGQSGTAWISLTKLEKGNKATDWSPAPEDLASQT
ncbi:cell envelope integrity protein TolA, partial [Pediococcus acidilactici]